MPRTTKADLEATIRDLKADLIHTKSLLEQRELFISKLVKEQRDLSQTVSKLTNERDLLQKDVDRMDDENKEDRQNHTLRIQEIKEDFQRQYDEKVQELNIEFQEKLDLAIQSQINQKPDKIHNERGAGRKPSLDQQSIQLILDYRQSGLTQQEIANKIGMSKATINRILKINSETKNTSNEGSIINNETERSTTHEQI